MTHQQARTTKAYWNQHVYIQVLRAAKLKDDHATLTYAKSKFLEDAASVKRSEFNKIEFLLRQVIEHLQVQQQ